MNFTARVVLGNAVVVVLTVILMTILAPMGALVALAVGIALLAGSSMVLWLLCQSAFKPLEKLVAAMEKAASGDLSAKVTPDGIGEIARLGTAFNAMMGDINRAMRQFFSVADLVRDSVALVGNTTASMTAAAEDVAMQAGTIATASEEMSATSSDIARNCLYAAENAHVASEQTTAGARIVSDSVKVMENIAQLVVSSSATVEALGSRSDQIGAIVGTIEDIADQTNLLALNAAIEAARAGEMGRGFAVVADEVRALAERTTKATKEISGMIKTIQAETQTAVSSMSAGVEQVKRGTESTTSSGEALEDILNKISELSLQISQVATAAEEQTATTSEITQNIQMITDVVQSNVDNARSTTVATQKLAEQVDELHKLVGRFRLSNALEWDSSFETGIRSIDEQHKVLFNMVNELHDAMQQKRSKEAIGQILNRLIDYTGSHFAHEENAFRTTGYPQEAGHKQLHAKLVNQVLELKGQFEGGQAVLTQSVIDFLQDWLTNHIKGEDKRYAPHLIKHGIK
ncbi:bacteriohemerythrin [Trichlorobacter ammonificans]|uniref:Methyl-accepting chemotaxis protein n=1 Tax=Trichlorobacter ammonificans TaxID=2916410 RepID=A0ABM9DAQ3_9BACT|nr:bacteriohemerythrin [Trichlorobacter ammonificans]CAH2031845.1 Methyl-accepting chemotaxis protein [Trichlorobacter ammonificans]